ncbi:hypothetical protein EPO66_01600 [bacterium]|nr:MAG: hypothetical protein EPO66_01600 [bacterium]
MSKKDLTQIGVIVVGVIFLIFSIMGSLKKKPKKPAALPSAGVSESKDAKARADSNNKAALPDDKKMKSQIERANMNWGRDPFSASLDKEYQISELKLQGISVGRDGRKGYAFINDEIVSKGEKVGAYEVVDIQKDKVLLKKGAQSFYLTFPAQ